jgi:hypothetical protein
MNSASEAKVFLNRPSRRVQWGAGILALGYFVAGHAPLLSLTHGNPAEAGGMAPAMALVVVTLVAVEILIALVPLRRGQFWAFWAGVFPLVTIGIPRMLTDPKCFAMSLHVHGCHQFMAGLLLAILGLVLAFPRRER